MIFPYSFPAGAMIMLFPFEHHWLGSSQRMQLQGLEIQTQTVPSFQPCSEGLHSSAATPWRVQKFFLLALRAEQPQHSQAGCKVLCVCLSVWCGVYDLQGKIAEFWDKLCNRKTEWTGNRFYGFNRSLNKWTFPLDRNPLKMRKHKREVAQHTETWDKNQWRRSKSIKKISEKTEPGSEASQFFGEDLVILKKQERSGEGSSEGSWPDPYKQFVHSPARWAQDLQTPLACGPSLEFNPDTLKTLLKFQNCIEINTHTENTVRGNPQLSKKIINKHSDGDCKWFKIDNKK